MRLGIRSLPRLLASAAAAAAVALPFASAARAAEEEPPEAEATAMSSVLSSSKESTLLAPTRTGKHCLDLPDARFLLAHTLGVQVNPLGVENQLALSICVPLITKPGVLFDFTNIELGLVNYLSPAYVHQGGFVGITPLSILKLRAEITGVGVWPFPTEGAAYYSLPSYQSDNSESKRPKGKGGTAKGVAITLSATFQAKVGLPRRAALLLTDTFLAEHWTLGDGDYYHNLRRDVLLARTDWVLRNTGLLVIEIPVNDNVSVRVGGTDELTIVPESGSTGNIVAGIGTILVKRLGQTFNNFQPFLRLGVYTQHASPTNFRGGEATALFGISTTYDLGAIEGEDAEPSR